MSRYYRDINSLAQWLTSDDEPISLVLDPNRDEAKLKQYDRACRMVDGDFILSFVKGVCCWTGVSVVETNKAKGHEKPLNALNSDDLWDQHFGYALDVRTDFQLTTPEQCFFTSNSRLGLKYQGRGIYMEMHRRADCELIVEAVKKTVARSVETIKIEMDSNPSMKRELNAFIREWDKTIKRDHYLTEIAIKNSGGKCDKCGTTAAEWVEQMQRARQDNGYRDVFSNSQYGYTFFDVHHKVPVAKGGGAVLKNLRALCPNCHRVISRNNDARQKDLKQHGLVRKGKRLTDKPLKIEGEACGKRIVDSLYKAGDNYYFLDTGWIDTPTHPDHPIGKLIASDGEKWTFQDDTDRLFYVSPIDAEDFSMLRAYKEWKEYLKKEAPKADGADFIRRDLGLGDVEIEQVG